MNILFGHNRLDILEQKVFIFRNDKTLYPLRFYGQYSTIIVLIICCKLKDIHPISKRFKID